MTTSVLLYPYDPALLLVLHALVVAWAYPHGSVGLHERSNAAATILYSYSVTATAERTSPPATDHWVCYVPMCYSHCYVLQPRLWHCIAVRLPEPSLPCRCPDLTHRHAARPSHLHSALSNQSTSPCSRSWPWPGMQCVPGPGPGMQHPPPWPGPGPGIQHPPPWPGLARYNPFRRT